MEYQNFQNARDHVAGLINVEKNFPEALNVMDTLPADWKDREAMPNFRLMAYLRLGKADAFTDLLLQRPAISDWPAWAVNYAYMSAIIANPTLRFDRATHDFLWGAPKGTLQDALQEMSAVPLPDEQVNALRQVVERATGRPIANPEEWEHRLRLGQSRNYYCHFLIKLQQAGAAKGDPQLETLIAQARDLVEEADLRPITDILESGRSVVLLELHAGYRPAQKINRDRLKWPFSFIDNGIWVQTATRDGDFHVRTNQPRTNFDFAQLCKLMRKTVRVARILPDGGQGQSEGKTEIGGVEVPVGLGAAQLAYFGKAAFVFGRTRWTDTGVKAVYFPGPVVEDSDSKDAAEEKLISFYRASTIDLLAGDPINFGLFGGYWPFFRGLRQ